MFESQVDKIPHQTAIVCEQEELTYAQLNKKINQLAHYIKEQEVALGESVGFCTERSINTVVCILAILKAGCRYVALDSNYPISRLEYIVQDLSIDLVMHDQYAPVELRQIAEKTVDIENNKEVITGQPQSNLERVSTAQDVMCVFYTSGSTGKPKGVEVRQQSVVNLVFNTFLEVDESSVMLSASSVSFDASTFELFSPILKGSKLVLTKQRVLTAKDLDTIIQEHGVTITWLTSSLFNQIVDTNIESLRKLTHLFIGGEALSMSHVNKLRKYLPHIHLYNGYGPTE